MGFFARLFGLEEEQTPPPRKKRVEQKPSRLADRSAAEDSRMGNDFMDLTNPLSPFSPLNPLNQTTPLHSHDVGPSVDQGSHAAPDVLHDSGSSSVDFGSYGGCDYGTSDYGGGCDGGGCGGD